MNDMIRMIGKVLLQMVLWVFILSISWGGRTLFERSHDVLVDNAIVAAIDQELADMWDKVTETARLTFAKPDPADQEAM